MKKLLLILLFTCLPVSVVFADVVKPALVEITVEKSRLISIEVRASIEALLTGINARYKNTKDAPNAEEYDVLRKMTASQLAIAFEPFKENLLQSVFIQANADKLALSIKSVEIPPTGYTKVPRISIITLTAQLPGKASTLRWYYPAEFGDNAVRVKQVDLEKEQWHWSQWQWLRDDEVSQEFSLTEIVNNQSVFDVVISYISIGFEHIVPKGLDHILFVLGLFLLSTHLRPLLWQVTMFTIAHTITLALAMNNIVNLPANIVEPLIALSIAYVGVENIYAKSLHKSRLVLVFCFGLLHGLGFASVLSDFGMPVDDFALALISFNVGVEFGQLAVILAAFVLLRLWFKDDKKYRRTVVLPGSALISVVGFYWFLERLELF
jgi:hydrogenase/urease accessory protein HupE